MYRFRKLFRPKNDFTKIEDVRLEYAFTLKGVKYYEPQDLNNFPWQRSLAATFAFNKLQVGVYPDDLQLYFKIVNDILTGQTFNVTSLVNWKRMNDVLRMRLDTKFRPEEMMWEVAAIFFLDDTESPYTYDAAYGRKKIEFWKKHKETTLFFSQLTLRRLIPFLPAIGKNLLIFSQTTDELKKIEKDISNHTLTNTLSRQQANLKNSQYKQSVKANAQRSKN